MDNQPIMKDLKIAYIGGGSRGWAWGLMSDLAGESQISGLVSLYDIDFDAAKANEIIGNRYRDLPEACGMWRYEAVASLTEALAGADFVVISILPGDFAAMAVDVHAPEEYGLYQSVGDTVGPGGVLRALRTIPMYEVIARAIRDHCPKAWVINYTNPMSICVRTLYRVFPGIKAFGCCHEVFGTQNFLAGLLAAKTGEPAVPRDAIKVNVLGINHFTWLDRISWQDQDLLPLYRQACDEFGAAGWHASGADHWLNSYFESANRVKMDLFRRYGCVAAAGDRHLAEFVPEPYLRSPASVAEWHFQLTPVSWRIQHRNELLKESRELVSGERQLKLRKTGEEGVHQMKALLGLGDLTTNVNLPNQGQQAGLPNDAVVETNAVFRYDQICPLQSGSLPVPVKALVTRHIWNQETIVEAALRRDLTLAFQAFANDPIVTTALPQTEALYRTMLRGTAQWLGDYTELQQFV